MACNCKGKKSNATQVLKQQKANEARTQIREQRAKAQARANAKK